MIRKQKKEKYKVITYSNSFHNSWNKFYVHNDPICNGYEIVIDIINMLIQNKDVKTINDLKIVDIESSQFHDPNKYNINRIDVSYKCVHKPDSLECYIRVFLNINNHYSKYIIDLNSNTVTEKMYRYHHEIYETESIKKQILCDPLIMKYHVDKLRSLCIKMYTTNPPTFKILYDFLKEKQLVMTIFKSLE